MSEPHFGPRTLLLTVLLVSGGCRIRITCNPADLSISISMMDVV